MNSQFNANMELNHSRSSSPTNGQLPYHWDGECHLVVNNEFYSGLPHTLEKSSDVNDSIDFDLGLDMYYEAVNIEPEPMGDYVSYETESVASTGVTAPSGLVVNMMESKSAIEDEDSLSLDAQLNFIMECTKKPPKTVSSVRKYKRSRKTPEQLAVLRNMLKTLDKGKSIGKNLVTEIAAKTGLPEMKVYKWFWDHGFKQQ